MLSYVDRLHHRVKGELAADAGPFPAGTPYSAFDPTLMLWTVAVMAESAQCFYELLIRPLSRAERDELWRDYVRFGELFGMPRDAAPQTWAEFAAWYRERLVSDDMFLTDEARYVGYATAFEIPMPAHQQPGKRVHDLLMLGSLPARVRELYGLPYDARQQLAFELAVRAVRTARRRTPAPLARGGNTRSFDGVAREERRRIEQGKPTPQIRDDGTATGIPRARIRQPA